MVPLPTLQLTQWALPEPLLASPWGPLLQQGMQAALAAGNLHRHYYEGLLTIEHKSSAIDLVTTADKAADAAIIEILSQPCLTPQGVQAKIITEETYTVGQEADMACTWIVDPLDGTTNFAHGFPFFAVSIGLVVDNVATVGMVFDALREEWFVGIVGVGAYLINAHGYRALNLTESVPLEQALLGTGFSYQIKDFMATGDRRSNLQNVGTFLQRCHGVRRAGAAALDLAYVAAGRLDGFWEYTLAPWDVAGAAALIVAAGGTIRLLEGEPLSFQQRQLNVIAGPAALVAAMSESITPWQEHVGAPLPPAVTHTPHTAHA